MIAPRDTSHSPDFPVPPALQETWIRELLFHHDHYNYLFANSRLRTPTIRLGLSRRRLGEWCGQTRCLTISGHHILENPWGHVLETLRHEMAHQYVHEVLGFDGVPPHGEAFRKACLILRADPAPRADADTLGTLERSADGRDQALVRVKKLLALAASPNEHEAANAMRLARKHLLKYNVDLAEVDRRHGYQTRRIGRCRLRAQEYEYSLGHLLQDHFFVRAIWIPYYDALEDRKGKTLEISGTPENLEMAGYVHDYVLNVSAGLWREHRRSAKAPGTKLQYLAGLVRGFRQKLDAQSRELAKEHGLIWTGDPALQEYYRYCNPRIASISSGGVSRSAGFQRGVADGKRLTIRRGVTAGSVNRGGLLS